MSLRRATWTRVTLEALGYWQGGSTPSKRISAYWTRGDIPWVSPKDFGQQTIGTSKDFITGLALMDSRATLIPTGALLFVTRSGVLRHSLPTAVTSAEVTINQDVKALVPAPGVNSTFLKLQIDALSDDLLEAAVKSGTTVESVDFDVLRRFPILITTPDEQDRVVAELTTALAKLDLSADSAQSSLETLDSLHSAALNSAFTGALTSGWRARQEGEEAWRPVALGEVVEKPRYGSAQKSHPTGEVVVLRMGNIQSGRLDWSNLVYTADPVEIRKHRLKEGDVLFNRTNSPELVGKTAVYHGEQPAIAAGYLIVVRCKPDILPEVLAHFLNSPTGRAYCWAVKSDGVSQSNINASKLEAFEFALPPLAEQTEILARLDKIFASIDSARELLERVLRDLRNLRRQILTAAFRPDQHEDEPAAEIDKLLEAAATFRANFAARPRRGKNLMPNPSPLHEKISALIRAAGDKGAAFDDIRFQITTDYESMKAEIFSLLQSATPRLHQVYDTTSGSIRLKARE